MLRWVERTLGGGATVVACRRLHGGLTTSVHRLTVEDAGGHRRSVVLKRWIPGSEEARESMIEITAREARTLEQVGIAGIPAPGLLGFTPGGGGRDGEHSAILMTRAPGRIDLTPADPHAWVAEMAATLATIHSADVAARRWTGWVDPSELASPSWTAQPDLWRAAIDAAAQADRDATRHGTFIHGDYQHFNHLWSRSRLRSVIDWTFAARGPAGIDVGHCRLNLAVLHSAELAEDFLAAYEAEVGVRVDPAWDLRALLSYDQAWKRFIPIQVAGRAIIDLTEMDKRVEATMAAALRRL